MFYQHFSYCTQCYLNFLKQHKFTFYISVNRHIHTYIVQFVMHTLSFKDGTEMGIAVLTDMTMEYTQFVQL